MRAREHGRTCRVIHINLVAFIKRFLEVLFDMFEEGECFKEVGENFKKEKIWGFEDSMDPNVQRARAFLVTYFQSLPRARDLHTVV